MIAFIVRNLPQTVVQQVEVSLRGMICNFKDMIYDYPQ